MYVGQQAFCCLYPNSKYILGSVIFVSKVIIACLCRILQHLFIFDSYYPGFRVPSSMLCLTQACELLTPPTLRNSEPLATVFSLCWALHTTFCFSHFQPHFYNSLSPTLSVLVVSTPVCILSISGISLGACPHHRPPGIVKFSDKAIFSSLVVPYSNCTERYSAANLFLPELSTHSPFFGLVFTLL